MKNICISGFPQILFRQCSTLFVLLFVCLSASNASNKSIKANDLELIMERIRTANITGNITTIENTATSYLQSVQSGGFFSDINYSDQSATNWQPQTHLDRLKTIVQAYTISSSKYYNDNSVYNSIVSMFSYWHNAHPVSTNWYMQEIASPQRIGIMLILMRFGPKQLPSDLETNLIKRIKDEGGDPELQTGANKLDVATHWIYRGCLSGDTDVLSYGIEQAYQPLFLTTEEGFQYDYSYHQHGSQLYLGGYGRVVIAGISNLALYLVDTPYALSGNQLELFSKFTREVYIPVIRGQYLMYNTLGRSLTRKSALSESGFSTILTRMISLDPQYKDFYEKTIERVKGSKTADYNLSPVNTHFWRSDYTLHQRPGYTMDIRMASVFSARNENGNGENLKGYFLTDGATQIALRGDEYVDIFPVWDWAKIPGTTAPDMPTIPKPAAWGVSGSSYFAGGVSNGKYGVSAYLLNDTKYSVNTKAKKSWFLFDNEIVCLGAGIASSATQQINTTINQSLLKGDVTTISNTGTTAILSQQQQDFTNLAWLLHDNVAYYFPQGGNISVSKQSQSGTWYSINTTQTTETVTKDVFKAWFNHGNTPSKGTYSYIIVPNKSSASEIGQYTTSDIEILENSDSLQVVRHKSLNILGLVFYKDATFSNNDTYVHADKACVIMLEGVNSQQVKMYISDPSRQNKSITVLTKLPSIEGTKILTCALPSYPDPYAGSTFEYVIDSNTTDYSSKSKSYIYPSADSYVWNGSYKYTNYGKEKTLVVKNDIDNYGRESYIKFDLQNLNIDASAIDECKIYLTLSVANTNTSIQETKWNISHVSNDTWEEDKITWNNKPEVDDLIITIPSSYAGTNVSADITEFALNEIEFGNKILTLHISSANSGSTTDASFYSRESGTSTSPHLLVETPITTGIENKPHPDSYPLLIYPSIVNRGSPVFVGTAENISKESFYEISVINTLGKTVLTTSDNNKIETASLMPGTYIVSAINREYNSILHSMFIVK